jgi:hypothetical protein
MKSPDVRTSVSAVAAEAGGAGIGGEMTKCKA